MHGRIIRQRQGMHAEGGHALDFGGGGLHVPPRHDHDRDEAARRGIAPVMKMPVVVRLDCGQADGLVRHDLETLAGKTGKRRKAQRTEHAIGVHVFDARLDIPGSAAHLLVRERLHAVLFLRPADHGVQAHVTGRALFENPDVAAIDVFHLRLAALVLGRHVAIERTARFNHMIVDTDENQIFQFHACLLCWDGVRTGRATIGKNLILKQ